MQEVIVVAVIVIMAALGVRMFLAQSRGVRMSLPSLRLPELSLPKLPRRRRAARGPKMRRLPVDDGEYDDERFDGARSPFVVETPSLRAYPPVPASPAQYDDEEDEEPYDDDLLSAYLPVSQVDFFADASENRPVIHRVPAAPDGAAHAVGVQYAGAQAEAQDAYEDGEYDDDTLEDAEAPEAPPADPNNIMAFFDKPTKTTQLPTTLLDAVEEVSAAELLAEARELSDLINSRRSAA